MKPFLLCLALFAVAVTAAPAQVINAARSDEIMTKMRKADMLIQILPLTLTKDQIPKLLIKIEKARQKQDQIMAMEADDLVRLDAKLSKAVDDGVKKGVYPSPDLQKEVYKLTTAFTIRRNILASECVDLVFEEAKAVLNDGQKKVMEKSLDASKFDPSLKVDQMSSDDKVKFFIRRVFLDPITYELLKDINKAQMAAGN